MTFSGCLIYVDGRLRRDLQHSEPADDGMYDSQTCVVYVPSAEISGAQPHVDVIVYGHGVLLKILTSNSHFRLSDKTPSYLQMKDMTAIKCRG